MPPLPPVPPLPPLPRSTDGWWGKNAAAILAALIALAATIGGSVVAFTASNNQAFAEAENTRRQAQVDAYATFLTSLSIVERLEATPLIETSDVNPNPPENTALIAQWDGELVKLTAILARIEIVGEPETAA